MLYVLLCNKSDGIKNVRHFYIKIDSTTIPSTHLGTLVNGATQANQTIFSEHEIDNFRGCTSNQTSTRLNVMESQHHLTHSVSTRFIPIIPLRALHLLSCKQKRLCDQTPFLRQRFFDRLLHMLMVIKPLYHIAPEVPPCLHTLDALPRSSSLHTPSVPQPSAPLEVAAES